MKKFIVIIIIVALLALGAWRTVQVLNKRRAADNQKVQEQPPAVEIQTVKRSSIQSELSLVGDIMPMSEVNIISKVPGKILEILVNEGSKVEKGKIMARLESKELGLQVKQAETAVQAANVAYNQAKSLSEVKIRSQIAQAQAMFSSAEAALKQVRDLSETRTTTQVAQAEAGFVAIKANLKKIKDGAREEEKRQIQATVQQAKAGLDNAKTDLERIENLYAAGAVSKQTLEGARTRTTVAEAQYEAASQQLRLVETGAREEDIIAVESQVKQAEAGLELAKSLAQTKSWEKDIEMAQGQYNQAKAALEAAKALENARSWEAEITAAETGVKQAQTALELAKEALSNATITAPITGTISKRFMDTGSMASPAMPLFTIVAMDAVKAVVDVTEGDLAKIKVGVKAFISVEGLSDKLEGRITLISPTLKAMSRTASVEITIDNVSHRLKPGMFARVNIPVENRDNTIVVRRSAIIEDRISGDKYVFVIDTNKSSKRKVETGISKDDMIEIISGISDGEKLVISGQNYIEDGQNVQVVKSIE